MEYVQLVDEQDNELGIMEKISAHREAKLHRALSVFVFNTKGEWLMQRRAADKYHSPMLWTNTCCTHPRPEERLTAAAGRRLQEEMGLSCKLEHGFSFIYKAALDNGMTEHELDHVFFGVSDDIPQSNTDEVAEWSYWSVENLEQALAQTPELFTEWFRLIFERVKEWNK